MTEYERKSFSVAVGNTKAYRDGWDAIFAKEEPEPTSPECSKGETLVDVVLESPIEKIVLSVSVEEPTE